jgi:diguanylate cyclase (GGDEF)-like protein
MNANRMITMFVLIASIEAILFFVELFFESNTEGFQRILVIKLVFVTMSLLFAVAIWHFNKHELFNLLRIAVILGVFASVLLAITNTLAAQALGPDITIYIMALFIITAVVRLPHNWYAIIYSICLIYFAFGMQTAQLDAKFIKWSLINAVILNIIAIAIAIMLYDQHVEIFLDKIRIDHQVETLQYMSEHDGLTNLYNHQTISRIIKKQIELSRESEDNLCVAVMDIDNFKTINDKYGHAVGDQALKDIAIKIEENVRKHDFVARYGGDEFIILFPDTTVDEANKICKRILDSINEAGPTEIKVTGSIGLVALTDCNYSDFIEKADMEMYKAKNTGKAKIVS